MSKSYILYKDIAPGAQEDAAVSSGNGTAFSVPSVLSKENQIPAYVSLDLNRWGLNGNYSLLGSNKVAFWSEELSGEDGTFANPPTIEVAFDNQYSSTGITLVFDTYTSQYCPSVMVQWYQDGALKEEETFSPDSSIYFCQKSVTSYDKIVVTLLSTMHPNERARLNQIIFGINRYFYMDELRGVRLVNEMDLSALSLPISTMTWNLDSHQDVDFMFQLKQPVEAWNDNNLIGVYYIDSYIRSAKNLYSIDCYDAIGVLDESPFAGGYYSDKSAVELLTEIIGETFELVFEVEDTTLNGVLLPATRREAAQQVLFAWGVCASTDGGESIRIFSPGEDGEIVGTDRTFPGISMDTTAIVTEVRVVAHDYAEDGNGSVDIGGVKYSDTKTMYSVVNPDVTANTKANVIEVDGATLVSPSIGQAVAQRVYDYYARRNTERIKVVWNGERLGDAVTQPTPWGTEATGNISRMEIKLSNTVVADMEALQM